MSVYRSVRVQMRDRPGALSALGAALAALSVDIVRLDVVSHEGDLVVDDLYLLAAAESDIDLAVAGFMDATSVTTFTGFASDPSRKMAERLREIATAGELRGAWSATASGALDIVYGSQALLLRVTPGGDITQIAGTVTVPAIGADDPFAGRWALIYASAAAFAARGEWAPPALREALGAAWIAVAPCGVADLLVVARSADMPFYAGELERLTAFSAAAAAAFALHGDSAAAPGWGSGRLNLPGDAVKVPVAA